MRDPKFNALFLCTGNSARSILAESLLQHWGKDKFVAYSAGSQPKGDVHPYALDLLRSLHLPSTGFRSKSWDEFATPSAPKLDFVFTVCDSAAQETCPVWPGQPMTAHWGVPDPAAATGREIDKRQAFREAFRQLENRIKLFTSLPVASLDKLSLQRKLNDIGSTVLRSETV
jgi:protein-tyrosine-phosphatase